MVTSSTLGDALLLFSGKHLNVIYRDTFGYGAMVNPRTSKWARWTGCSFQPKPTYPLAPPPPPPRALRGAPQCGLQRLRWYDTMRDLPYIEMISLSTCAAALECSTTKL